MVNFCIVGRDCPLSSRRLYTDWDASVGERKLIAASLSKEFPELDFVIGGSISIDIVPRGFSKSQIAAHLRQMHPSEKIVFFGDMICAGGNDFDLAHELLQRGPADIVPVTGPNDVLQYLLDYR
jgi:hypothetical protein